MPEHIEREALKWAFQDIDAGRRDGWATSLSPEEAADYLAEYLDDIPAADVAPVKHGHWDNISESCSVCGSHWAEGMVMNADDWGYFDPMPAYCPYCGAKMDGGNDNDR